MAAHYYDYQLQTWCPQTGEREVERVGSDGTVYYVDTAKREARRARAEAYRSCGMVRVRGNRGGEYWE